MTFASIEFLIFIVIIFVLYYFNGEKLQKPILLLASIFFIVFISPVFLIYTTLFILVNYLVGSYIGKTSASNRKLIYYLGQIFNIGGLVFFKYINFIIDNLDFIVDFFSSKSLNNINILVPIGISYYTFQGISYLYLIFKSKDQAERNLTDFSIYMIFFPKFLAGPIEIHRSFLPQLKKKIEFSYSNVIDGANLFLWGLFKKVVIADTFSVLVSSIYENTDIYSGSILWITFLIQPMQLYCDFSGYTDMALGLGRIFGYKLSPNFNRPFLAKTVGEFWRRYHISLSSWCNNFIYNRIMIKRRKWKNWAVYYAITSSFVIIGVWHGADWSFVVLGILQAAALIYEFYSKQWRKNFIKKLPVQIADWGSRVLVYLFYALSLIFFYGKNLKQSLLFLKGLFNTPEKPVSLFTIIKLDKFDFYFAVLLSILIIAFEYMKEKGKEFEYKKISIKGLKWSGYIIVLLLVSYFSRNQSNFVYTGF